MQGVSLGGVGAVGVHRDVSAQQAISPLLLLLHLHGELPPRLVPQLISYSLISAGLFQRSFITLTSAIHFPNVSYFAGDVFLCSDKLILRHQ